MSKYIPNEMVKEYHGKICMHSDVYFAKRNGTLYTGKICNPYKGEPSVAQVAQREKFRQAQAATVAALADTAQRAAYMAAFKSQKKYKDFRSYVFAMEYAKL